MLLKSERSFYHVIMKVRGLLGRFDPDVCVVTVLNTCLVVFSPFYNAIHYCRMASILNGFQLNSGTNLVAELRHYSSRVALHRSANCSEP